MPFRSVISGVRDYYITGRLTLLMKIHGVSGDLGAGLEEYWGN
jgi:hypothetical protein